MFEHPSPVLGIYYYPQGQISTFHQELCGEKQGKCCQLVSRRDRSAPRHRLGHPDDIQNKKIPKSLSQPHLLRGVCLATEAVRVLCSAAFPCWQSLPAIFCLLTPAAPRHLAQPWAVFSYGYQGKLPVCTYHNYSCGTWPESLPIH